MSYAAVKSDALKNLKSFRCRIQMTTSPPAMQCTFGQLAEKTSQITNPCPRKVVLIELLYEPSFCEAVLQLHLPQTSLALQLTDR